MAGHDPETVLKYVDVFFPYAKKRTEKVRDLGGRFVYYTSAATACSILKHKEVWLRNVRLMNDYSEVAHGWLCLKGAWNDPDVQAKLTKLFDQVGPDVKKRIQRDFDSRFQDRVHETYIICISEHGSALIDDDGHPIVDEDLHGRLSMWRAYGGDTNVAFVFNSGPFFRNSDAFHAFTSPVLYADPPKFQREFVRFLDCLEANVEWLKEMGADFFVLAMEGALVAALLSTKHPAFAEEREWRIIYSPSIRPSKNIKMTVEVVGGIPQRIQRLPLKDIPEEGLVGITIPDFVDRIIIGPTQEPNPIAAALGTLMFEAKVPNPYERIKTSNVPLRK